jgi:HSP20 family protein
MEAEFDRFLNEGFFGRRPFRRLARSQSGFAPSVDVFDQNGAIVVKAELPGVKKEDISAMVENGDLVIKGTRAEEKEVKETDYYRMERSSGTFYRRIPLPEGVKTDDISAKYEDGVLEVRVPQPAESTPTSIPISVS